MAKPEEPRRRFAPVPIETTFQSVRKGAAAPGPNPELTPEPSPRSPSPPIHQLHELQVKRRFHPQLIETSRRVRRVGDEGPATKPTDKTDITPYTNHIYTAKSKQKRRRGQSTDDEPQRPMPPTRRETEEEGVKEYLLELAARDAARQMEEAALAAFPNSRAREGGVAHFYYREGSDSDNSPDATPLDQDKSHIGRTRRKSSSLELTWWHKHMQTHAEKIAHDRQGSGDDAVVDNDVVDNDAIMRSDSDLDRMELPATSDPLWTTNSRVSVDDRRDSPQEPKETSSLGGLYERNLSDAAPAQPTPGLAEGGPVKPHTPDTVQRGQPSPFGYPFGAFGVSTGDPRLLKMRQAASPPMLGKDLTFRKCPSPKQTKLETDHSFIQRGIEEENRDITGAGGLWNGYCCKSETNESYIVPAGLHAPDMMVTPHPPSSPQGGDFDSPSLSEEPASLLSSSDSSDTTPSTVEHRCRSGKPKGLHMLHGLDERLQDEKLQADREDKISQEFGDEFVTQVYNYLSLGYPAMAHAYDEELSKISLISVDELCRGDSVSVAKGHMLEMKLEETSEEMRCPRWKALRTYIMEWARQHPNLDSLDPLAWGVRARRGSWAI